MAGNPADLTKAPYKDTDYSHDHTYYGHGCSNGWGTSGEGGSQTPCADSDAGGRYVKTADNETQKNGTYYNFQAATVGAGGAMDTDKSDSPYTFCPLGWQLPYSGTGGDYDDKSRSWNHLFKSYDLHIGDGTATDATKIKSYPFSYVYSGTYSWYTGRLYNQSNNGVYWSSTVVSSSDAYLLYTWSSVVRPADTGTKAGGRTVRCVRFLASLIDGTVAGTDVQTGNIDTDANHDHSYYGNGCNAVWNVGTKYACETRIVATVDGEDQKNGAYYNFQAGTSGAGAAITTDNTNSSDTFCPLGWQLPHSGTDGDYYDKSKSWRYLFNTYSIPTGDPVPANESNKIKSYPFSYIHSGHYSFGTGLLYIQGSSGIYQSRTNNSSDRSFDLNTWATAINVANFGTKVDGKTIHCTKNFSILLPLRVRICVIQKLKASFHFFISLVHRRHGDRNRYLFIGRKLFP